MKRKLCKSCQRFIKKFKPWDDKKDPGIAIMDYAECRKCRMTYQIYKGMILAIPVASKKQLKEMKADSLILPKN